MKTKLWQRTLATAAVAGLGLTGPAAWAQNTTAAAAPELSYGAQEVLKLEQAKVSDDVIVSYIRSSGLTYAMTADQIVYLRSQGVSNPVLTAMLGTPGAASTPVPAPSTVAASQPAPAPVQTTAAAPATTVVVPSTPAPTVTYVPDTTYYYDPYYYSYPYYYGWYPGVSLYWGGGWYGGGWHGGWHGGGGGWHGGGGGFHGGGGGWHH